MMNKDFRKTLDARLSGMRWGEREQEGVLRRVRQENAPQTVPAKRSSAVLVTALAALMIVVGSLLTHTLPTPEPPLSTPEQAFERIGPAAAPNTVSANPPENEMNVSCPTFETDLLTIGVLKASAASDSAMVQLCIQPREENSILVHASDTSVQPPKDRQDLHVTLRLASVEQENASTLWQGTQTLAFSGYAEYRFETADLPSPDALPILLTVEVRDASDALLESTECPLTLTHLMAQ